MGNDPPENSPFGELYYDEPEVIFQSSFCPWEDIENLGFFQGLLQTVQTSLFSVREFFSRLPLRGGFLNPLLYALIVETVGNMAGYVAGMAFENPFLPQSGFSGGAMVLLGLMIPPLVLLGIFFWALLIHLSLFVVGGAKQEFEASFRVVCYSSAADLFNVVPLIGAAVAVVWKTYMLIVGIREVHQTTTGRAAAAIFLPLLMCCGLVGGGVLLLLMGISGSVG